MSHFALPTMERPVQLQSLELGLISRLDPLHRAPPLLREAGLCTFVFILGYGFDGEVGNPGVISRGPVRKAGRPQRGM